MSFFTSPSPAPTPSAFGSSNPSGGSTSAFSFGSTPAPATGNLFGGTTTAAPVSGFSFGAAPAPSAFGQSTPAFGASPAPAFGQSTFGAPAPAPGFGFGGATSTAPAFGAPTAAPQQQQQAQQPPITSQTPYSSLPPDVKNVLDTIYGEMMRHKRIMSAVETESPALLRGASTTNGGPDKAGGVAEVIDPNVQPLPVQLALIESQLKSLQQSMDSAHVQAQDVRRQFETSTVSSVQYGLWPIEAVATRRSIKLSKHTASSFIDQKATSEVKEQIQKSLDLQAAHVDRLEQIPSPYFWKVLQDFFSRIAILQDEIKTLESNSSVVLNMYNSNNAVDVSNIVQAHANKITQLMDKVSQVHQEMENLRANYSRSVQNTNQVDVLQQARIDEAMRQQRFDLNAQASAMKAAPTPSNAPPAPTAAPASTSTFGTSTTSGFEFGSTTPAPAPSTGGLFGGASSTTGTPAFGAASTPAPAPTTGGGLFGATSTTPAPATGSNLFGTSSTTPAPATGAPSAPLFGAAPAPAGHGIFGATPGTATSNVGGGFTFGSTSSTASTPKAKSNKSRPRR